LSSGRTFLNLPSFQRRINSSSDEHLKSSSPVFNAEDPEKSNRYQNHDYMPPAVKGVKQAHSGSLVLRGGAFHDGAGQNLQKAGTDGIDDYTDQNAYKG
jgi:hypothetical protein